MTIDSNSSGIGEIPPDPLIMALPMTWAVQRRQGVKGPYVQVRIGHPMGVTEYIMDCDMGQLVSKMFLTAATGLELP